MRLSTAKTYHLPPIVRWYVVPDYRPDGQPSRSATVVNRAGELVATFESLEDAERAVEAVNGRT